MDFQLLVVAVKSDLTQKVVEAAKKVGAPGSTVLPAHGTGITEAKTFFGLDLDISTDVILFLLEKHIVDDVLAAVNIAGDFEKPGTGIAFVLPVEKTLGLQAQMPHFKRMLKRHEVSTENSN
jgi:nitrogen regulatory protein P-II 1